jgi:hypothetical protein
MKAEPPDDALRSKILRTLQLGRAVRFVWQSARGSALAHGGLVVIQGVLPLLPLVLTKLLVDAVTAGVMASDMVHMRTWPRRRSGATIPWAIW